MAPSQKPYAAIDHADPLNRNIFAVNWTYFNVCNYSCSYCIPELHEGSQKGPAIDVAKGFISRTVAAKADKKVYFQFSGGEITHFRHFDEMMAHIKDLGAYVGIISNGSKAADWWRARAHLLDHVCLSYHSESADPSHFRSVIEALHGKCTINVNVMMLPQKFWELRDFAASIVADFEGVTAPLQTLFHEFRGAIYPYTEEQKQILAAPNFPHSPPYRFPLPTTYRHKEFRGLMQARHFDGSTQTVCSSNLTATENNRWQGWACSAGIENLAVDYLGNIRRAVCNVNGPVGSIADETFVYPERPVICPFEVCSCGFDIMSSKRNIFRLATSKL